MGRNLLVVLFATGLLAAQAPPAAGADEALDLAALAAELDPGELPAVLAQLPADRVAWLRGLAGFLSLADVDAALAWGATDRVRMAAAVAALDQDEQARATAAGLWREIRACRVFARSEAARASEAAWSTATGQDTWWHAAADAAQRRRQGLAARLLRQHADSELVGSVLLQCAADLAPDRRARLRRDGLRRLGGAAVAWDFAVCAREALRDGDLAAAAALADAAAAAPPAAALVGRERSAELLQFVREHLALAQPFVGPAREPELAGRIALLRLRQACGSPDAAPLAAQLAAEDVPHALPFSVLAVRAATLGRQDEATAWLARAEQRPGRDATTGLALLLGRIWPLIAARDPAADADDRAVQRLQAAFDALDATLVDDDSTIAQVFRWLRDELQWPSADTRDRLGRSLPAVRRLQQELPGSLPVTWLVLQCAALATHADAGVAALCAPLPAPLARLHDLVRARAELFVRNMVAGRGGTAGQFESLLGDLERTQQDVRDARYLRGVQLWHEAVANNGDGERMRQARDAFVAAQRGPAEPGWWRAAGALATVRLSLGEDVDVQALLDRAGLRDDAAPHIGASLLCAVLLSSDFGGPFEQDVRRMLQRVDSPALLLVLCAADADGCARRGDRAGAARAAKQAVAAASRLRPSDLPHDGGVFADGEFRIDYRGSESGGVELSVGARCDLWVVPMLPGLDRLKLLAADK